MSSFPTTRLRRLRRTGALRSLVREARLDLDEFVFPLFVGPESLKNDALPAMGRFSVEDLPREAEELSALGVKADAIYSRVDADPGLAEARNRRTASDNERILNEFRDGKDADGSDKLDVLINVRMLGGLLIGITWLMTTWFAFDRYRRAVRARDLDPV